MEKLKEILKKQVSEIKPTANEKEETENLAREFIKKLEDKVKKKKIKAEVFLGGSLAKGTLIRKQEYDIDIFIRFDKKYGNKISDILGKIMEGAKKIHGSRDYYQMKQGRITFEIVPVLKIKNPNEAKNVTDLSYFHVNYIKNKINKNRKLAEEIMLAKAFCYAQDCYGAEGYIRGFSGYALELLVCYYGSFLKFIKEVKDKEKIILDPGKFYKNRQEIMLELNESKLQSPMIFVDPTFKERNALAALSAETLHKFKEVCMKFLGKPGEKFFKKQEIEKELRKKYKKLIILKIGTDRQSGDIAGSKLKKFYDFLVRELGNDFDIQNKYFEYDKEENIGKIYLVLRQKKEIIIRGPPINSVEHLINFKKKHKNFFIKKDCAYAREKTRNIKERIKELKDSKITRQMDINKIELI